MAVEASVKALLIAGGDAHLREEQMVSRNSGIDHRDPRRRSAVGAVHGTKGSINLDRLAGKEHQKLGKSAISCMLL